MHSDELLVACLCAAWCDTCREYRAVFDGVMAGLPALQGRWVDIEDEADVLGNIDVDDFPTVLIGRGDQVLFFGPITPQQATLERLLRAAADGSLAAQEAAPTELLARLSRRA
jgi:hypothetical protein